MKQHFFYFSKFKTWDYVTLFLYLVLSATLYCLFRAETKESPGLFMAVFFFNGFLLLANYRAMRNLSVYLCWFAIGIAHYAFYEQIKGGQNSFAQLHSLKSTLPLLLLYQVVRFFSVKIQHQEFVVPSKGSKTDFWNERKVTLTDMGFTVILAVGLVILTVFADFI